MNTANEVKRAVAEALARGDKVDAIKLLREAGGGDLKGALALVQRFAADAQANGADASGTRPQQVAPPRAQAATQALQAAERQTESLLGVKRTPTVMPGDSGGRGAIWLLLVLLGAIAWVFLH